MKKLLLLALTITEIAGCQSHANKMIFTMKNIDTSLNIDSMIALASDEVPSTWNYYNDEDKMTSKESYFANINATKPLYFSAPYNQDINLPYLIIRKRPGYTNEVLLTIKEGQFLDNIEGNRTIRVRFDSAAPVRFGYSNPSDYSTTAIFINNASKFIRLLKKSSHLIVECEFYNEGLQTMEFNIKDFGWNH